MRKYLAIIMLTIIALVLMSCGPDPAMESAEALPQSPVIDETTTTNTPKQPSDDPGLTIGEGKLSEVYQDMMKNGNYTMKYKTIMEIEDGELEMEITLVVMDDMTAMIMDTDDLESTTIYRDNAIYIISHENKTIMVMPEGIQMESEEINPDDLGDYNMNYIGSGREDFMGNNRKYEEYALEDGSVKYYFDGDELEGMKMIMGDNTSIMEIEEMSNTVDESLFELPVGYQEIKLGM